MRMRQRVREFKDKVVLAIDDADMYGRELLALLHDLVPHTPNFLFAFAVRAGKLDQITTAIRGHGDFKVHEHVVPPLTDGEHNLRASACAVLYAFRRATGADRRGLLLY